MSFNSVLLGLIEESLSFNSSFNGLIDDTFSNIIGVFGAISDVFGDNKVFIGLTGDDFILIILSTFMPLIYLWPGTLFGDSFCKFFNAADGTLTGDFSLLSCEKSERKFDKFDFKSISAIYVIYYPLVP